MAENRLEIILGARTSEFNSAIRDSNKAVDEMIGGIERSASRASLALGAIAAGGAYVLKSFVQTTAQFEQYRATLRAVIKDNDAAEAQFQRFLKFEAIAPFGVDDVVQAGVALKSLGAEADRFLPLASDLAAVTGRTMPEAARTLAKALAGSQDGLQQLQDTFLISKRELGEFNKELKNTDGSIKTKNLDKLADAIEAVGKAKFGGTAAAQAKTLTGILSTLGSAITNLKNKFGEDLAPTAFAIVKVLQGLANAFLSMPDSIRTAIVGATLFGTVLAGIGAIVGGSIVTIGALVSAYATLTGASGQAAVATEALATAELGRTAGAQAVLAASVEIAAGYEAEWAAAVQATAGVEALAIAEGQAAAAGVVAAEGAAAAAVGFEGMAVAATTAGAAGQAAGVGMLAALGPLAPVLLAIGAIATGVALVIANKMSKAADEAEKVFNKAEKQAEGFRHVRDAVIEASDALREYGGDVEAASDRVLANLRKTRASSKDAIAAMLKLRKEAAEARDRGEDALSKRLRDRATAIELAVRQYAQEEKALNAAAKAQQEWAEKAAVAFESFKEDISEVVDATAAMKRDQLTALDAIIEHLDKTSKEYKAATKLRIKLSKEVIKLEKEEAIRSIEARVKREEAAGRDVTAARVKTIRDILKISSLSAKEREEYEINLVEAEKALQDRRVEITRSAAGQRLEIEQQAAENIASLSETEISALEKKLEKGEDVSRQIEKQIQLRQKAAEESARLAAEEEKAAAKAKFQDEVKKDPGRRKELAQQLADELTSIEQTYQANLKSIRQKGSDDLEELSNKAKTIKLQQTIEEVKLEQKAADQRIEIRRRELDEAEKLLKDRQDRGQTVSKDELLKQAQVRAKFENEASKTQLDYKERLLKLGAKLSSVGKGEAEQKIISAEAELDITDEKAKQAQAAKEVVSDLIEQTDELKKQTQEIKDQSKAAEDRNKFLKEELGPINAPADGFKTTSIEDTRQQFLDQRAKQRQEEERKKAAARADQEYRSSKAKLQRELDKQGISIPQSDQAKNDSAATTDRVRPTVKFEDVAPRPAPLETPLATPLENARSQEALFSIAKATQDNATAIGNLASALLSRRVTTKPGDEEDSIRLGPGPRKGR